MENNQTQNEVFTPSQRLKAKATFKKNKAKILLGRAKAAKRVASPEKLRSRSLKKAREKFFNKLSGGKKKDELSLSQRGAIEKKLKTKEGAIKKLAKKLLPIVKIKDKEKFKKNNQTESYVLFLDGLNKNNEFI